MAYEAVQKAIAAAAILFIVVIHIMVKHIVPHAVLW